MKKLLKKKGVFVCIISVVLASIIGSVLAMCLINNNDDFNKKIVETANITNESNEKNNLKKETSEEEIVEEENVEVEKTKEDEEAVYNNVNYTDEKVETELKDNINQKQENSNNINQNKKYAQNKYNNEIKKQYNKTETENNKNGIEESKTETEENVNYSDEYKEYIEKTDEEKKEIDVIPRKEKVEYDKLEEIIDNQEKDLGIDYSENNKENNKENNEVNNQDEVTDEKVEKLDENNNCKEEKEEDKEKTEEREEKEPEKEKTEEGEEKEPDKKENDGNEEKEEEKNEDNDENDKQNVIDEEEEDTEKEPDKKDEDNQLEDNEKPNNNEIALPSKFNLNQKINLKVENQGGFGLCWDFASMNCVETNLALTQNKEYDFSEIHVDYLTSKDMSKSYRNIHDGGNFEIFMEYVLNFNGFILETELEYKDYTIEQYQTFINMKPVEESVYEIVDFPSYYGKNSEIVKWTNEEFKIYQDAIKTHIMNYGSLYTVISPTVLSIEPGFCETYNDHTGDFHAVSIVGWDDNYSKNNFKSKSGKTPDNDGAYIILNSWGEAAGEQGYHYISYEDYFVHNQLSGVISTNKEDLLDLNKLNNKELENYIKEEFKGKIIKEHYINKLVISEGLELDLSNRNLKSLKGIELLLDGDFYYKVDLSNNNLTSVEELKNLKISTLLLANNNIKDVSCLEDNEFIFELDLSNNKNVKGYEQLTHIYTLYLQNCDIEKLENLDKLKNLGYLNLSDNMNIKNLECLKTMNLFCLELSNCNIKEIDKISNYESLYYLNISKNKEITDLNNLGKFQYIEMINLSDCNIEDISIFAENLVLYSLDLSNNKNLKNINKIKNVQDLNLSNCGISDISELSTLKNIERLNLSNNNIKDITELKNIKDIYMLDLSGNKELTGKLDGTNISELYLQDCNLNCNFDFLGITEINYLDIRKNNLDYKDVNNKVLADILLIDEINLEDVLQDDINPNRIILETTINKTIKVPRGVELKIDLKKLGVQYFHEIKTDANIKLNEYFGYVKLVPISNGEISFKGVNVEGCICNSTITINYEIDDTVKPEEIRISRLPKKYYYYTGDELDFSGVEVEEVYGNIAYRKIDEFEMFEPEVLAVGNNTINVYKGNLHTYFNIYYIDTSTATVLDFENEELFKNLCIYLNSYSYLQIINLDKENYSVELTKTGVDSLGQYLKNWGINSSMLNDIKNFGSVDIDRIYIRYDGTKITNEHIEMLKSCFPSLEIIEIYNATDEFVEDMIVEQDLFKVRYF